MKGVTEMKKKYNAEIRYKMLLNHPDKEYVVGGWAPDKVLTHKDVYTINPDCFIDEDDIDEYITYDLMFIAGGGYRTDTIELVSMDIWSD